MTKYTKLFRPSNGEQNCCAQIHSNHYSCTFEHILAMTRELKKDFSVEDKDIQVQKYGGRRVKGITFVEVFLPKDTKMPEGFEEIKEIEYIL